VRPPRRRSTILGETDSLLAKYLDAEDYDLSGEVLWAWPLLRARWSPPAQFGFRVLASVEDRVGLLPCGNINPTRLVELEGEERKRYALGTAYHTAFVMGFLCAISLRPGRRPPNAIVGRQFDGNCLDLLLRESATVRGYWQSEFFRLRTREQQALVPMIADIVILQKCRARDYEGVKDILRLADDHGFFGSAICRQSTELLGRMMSCSAAIGGI
jgi:hypothetical protein